MDVLRIIKQEGYRLDDLSEENQKIVWHVHHIIESLEWMKVRHGKSTDATLWEQVYDSIANEVIDSAMEWLTLSAAEMQISLAESEPDD